ncbi:HNH endonuclease signature motif containing protein [Singulisphaera acidiphila]|uniref:Putative HNH nuclease YajD n=1 Tax=Singulisphaera acidiphila (strain ATCC BAA-1392 / DSM 18658 / VKM B-2454 / MOB10) TaxID=886293 RepID=L0DIT0_SINAD|nr:HNH endonuclease signature motif containing protein [Singulisphaera acidiphila]AGA28723.1 HNH endonuclease [Singulisphaera acidiphila DSM 18658]
MPKKIPTFRPAWMLKPEVKKKVDQARYDRRPDRREDNAFYTGSPWRKLKTSKLRQDPLCQRCSTPERPVAATIVHHIKERKDFPDLELDWDNLESVCASCHSTHHGYGNKGRAERAGASDGTS